MHNCTECLQLVADAYIVIKYVKYKVYQCSICRTYYIHKANRIVAVEYVGGKWAQK